MTGGNDLTFRRVVVALDAATDCAAAIEMAASVAAGWGASLRAMFVEDEELVRLAALPFAQQIDPVTALRSRLDAAALQSGFAAQAQQMRRDLQAIADRHALPWSFQVTRAAIGAGALCLAEDDLVVVAVTTRPIASRVHLESPWRRVLGQVRHSLLLVPERPSAAGPVAVFYEETQAGRRALDASRRIARAGKRALLVVVREDTPPALQAEIEASIRAEGSHVTLRTLSAVSKQDLHEFIAASHATLLVVGRDGSADMAITDLLPLSPTGAMLVL
ncbi:MAG: hypothetical protein IT563_11740 [Alphaproteobacteria bacterium]|nr:hypothetical protein [Alphaproteobacteria bacterium]